MSDSVEYKGYTIEIEQDEQGLNPRVDYSNGGTMVCFHRRYELGDRNHGFSDAKELIEHIKSDEVLASLPLFLYDHSGITMSTGAFSCNFDSGQVGIIFIDQAGCDEIGYDEGWRKSCYPDLTMKEALEKVLESEVKEFDKYISEGSYGFNIEEIEDSCGGFLGYDHEESGLLEHARSAIDCEIQCKLENRIEKLKEFIKAKVPVIYRVLPSL
jgi:hypothetical protein